VKLLFACNAVDCYYLVLLIADEVLLFVACVVCNFVSKITGKQLQLSS